MLVDAMEDSSYYHPFHASIHMPSILKTEESYSASGELNGGGDSGKLAQQMAAGMPGKAARIGSLATPFPIFPASALVSEVAYFFDTQAKAQGAVIVNQGSPIGILMKEKLHQMLAGQFGLPLYWNRPVERIMNKQPLIVDEQLPVEQVSQLAMSRDFTQLNDVVLITREGQLTGAATVQAILEYMTSLRTEAARGANPLTGLPGNEEIQLELQRRIGLTRAVAVIYADLDYFKWYNDMFGFGLGDNLICFLANVLREEIGKLGGEQCFIGHIGGDDFIVITEESSAEQLCQSIIQRFDSGIKAFYGDVEVTSVEDRHGNVIEQEGVTLSLSLMIWDGEKPVTPEYISRFSAKLKKKAKAHKGSVYVKELIQEERHEAGLST
ncbi:RNase II stability modulator [compost metagenome]